MPNQNKINAAIPISVFDGGTGISSTTAYGVLCAGTTNTGPIQNAGAGTSGQFLISNGAGALPSFQNSTDLVWISTTNINNGDASVEFKNLSNAYNVYYVIFENVQTTNDNVNILHQCSSNNGVSYIATGYTSGQAYNNRVGGAFVGIVSSTTNFVVGGISNTTDNNSNVFTIFNIGAGKPVVVQSMKNKNSYYLDQGSLNSASIINAHKIYPQTSTYVSGQAHLYGQIN